MSQMVTRKGAVNEDKEKTQTDSPVKEMKKKIAANAEKEKQAAEKQADKPTDKSAEKSAEKSADKSADKNIEKAADKKADKNVEKKSETKTDTQTDKPKKEDSSKGEQSGKNEQKQEKKPTEPSKDKTKQNGESVKTVHNGVTDVTLTANGGADDVLNGTVSGESDDDDVMLVIDDHDQDELFPELSYDDGSDVECFEPPTPENAPSRSLTRRSQVKATRTPETPRPASDKQADKDANKLDDVKETRTPDTPRPASDKQTDKDANKLDDSKDTKVLKLKEDTPSTDRRLRSADSPKPQDKKQQEKAHESAKKLDTAQEKGKESTRKTQEKQESPKKPQNLDKGQPSNARKNQEPTEMTEKESESQEENENGETRSKIEVEVVVEMDENQAEEPRKLDTNYSKSRVKVSPYRRSMRLADQTASSVMANYSGNNTTMEMDITESSSLVSEEPSLSDSPYLSSLRHIRGRRSYKLLRDLPPRRIDRSAISSVNVTVSVSETASRPTGTVVGRKRKPEADVDDSIEMASEADESVNVIHGKRIRLLDRISQPFRRTLASTPLPRRAAEIVGINTDLPLTAPVASPEILDPESLKNTPLIPTPSPIETVPTVTKHDTDRDGKKCIIM